MFSPTRWLTCSVVLAWHNIIHTPSSFINDLKPSLLGTWISQRNLNELIQNDFVILSVGLVFWPFEVTFHQVIVVRCYCKWHLLQHKTIMVQNNDFVEVLNNLLLEDVTFSSCTPEDTLWYNNYIDLARAKSEAPINKFII